MKNENAMTMYEIIKKYHEPHRAYHNFNHIVKMFDKAYEIGLNLSDEQIMAILFHDVFYYPGDADNEMKSAKIFLEYYQKYKITDLDATKVQQIILDTKPEFPTIEESKYVIDLDLSVLGIKHYVENSILIQREFSIVYTLDQFKKGRIKWIESFLEREKIYVSDHPIFKQMENVARDNLKNELIALKNK